MAVRISAYLVKILYFGILTHVGPTTYWNCMWIWVVVFVCDPVFMTSRLTIFLKFQLETEVMFEREILVFG